uniref:Protein bicaudal D n=1 Tax=Heterorhabditis bacteriophora TaxID=37862 RepID=A0A1I7X613_HETBA
MTSAGIRSTDDMNYEYEAKVKQLMSDVRASIEDKQKATQRLITAVNEVKKLEMELDRTGQILNDLEQKYKTSENAMKELRTSSVLLRNKLDKTKTVEEN